KYYELQLKLQRDFRSETFWPVFQFFFAVGIVTLIIYLIGILPSQSRVESEPFDPLGLGLLGEKGALVFAGVVFGALAAGVVLYKVLRRVFQRRAIVEWCVFHLPVLGPCLMALVLTRFCTAFRLMLQTDLSIRKALRLSLLATDNQLFIQS